MKQADKIYNEYEEAKKRLVRLVINTDLPSSVLFDLDQTNSRKAGILKQYCFNRPGFAVKGVRIRAIAKQLIDQTILINSIVDNSVNIHQVVIKMTV